MRIKTSNVRTKSGVTGLTRLIERVKSLEHVLNLSYFCLFNVLAYVTIFRTIVVENIRVQ